jgi:uncharacterized protein
MKPQTESKNIVAVRRLYEARGNPDIVKTVIAPDGRWEVVDGFPYSRVYQRLNGVADFFMRLFGDIEDWHTEPAEIFEPGDRVIGVGFYAVRAKANGKSFKARFAHVWTMRDGVIVRLQTVRGHGATHESVAAEFQPRTNMNSAARVIEAPMDVNTEKYWHPAVIPKGTDWVTIFFTRMPAEEVIEKRPGAKQMLYLDYTPSQ